MKRFHMLAVLALLVLAESALGAATSVETFCAAHRDICQRGTVSLLTAKGEGDNDSYMVEIDPATGFLNVNATITLPYDTNVGAAGADTLRVVTSTDSTVITNMTDSSVRIGDGTDEIAVEADGSINVNSNMRTLDATTPGDNVQIMDPITATPLYIDDDGSGHGAALVQANALPLPTGAATEAKQDTGNTSLSSIDTHVSALDGLTFVPEGLSVSATVASSALPTGAATAANQSTANTSLSSIDGKLTDGAGTSASALRVTLASDSARFTGRSYADSVRNAYASTNVTTGAWVELIASTAATINELRIFDSCGETLELGTGAAAAETRKLIIPPGGFDSSVQLAIPASTRISIRAISGNCTTGEIDITGLN